MAKMIMLRFDESKLIADLADLADRERVVFAIAAATRLFCIFSSAEISSHKSVEDVIDRLWLSIVRGNGDVSAWSSILDDVMDMLPDETTHKTTKDALVEDALSALAYSIRCFMDPKPQEAAWAARRAYEAADQAAIRRSGLQPGGIAAEAVLMSHEFVQRELSRQEHDIVCLRRGAIDEVRAAALKHPLLTQEELASLPAY